MLALKSLIINSLYAAPSKHWKFIEEDASFERVKGCREAGYMVADPKAKLHQDDEQRNFPFFFRRSEAIETIRTMDDRRIESLKVMEIVEVE